MRHCSILEAKWINNLSYAFRVKPMKEVTKIRLISEILIQLHQQGWNPLISVPLGKDKNRIITICFEKSSENSILQKSSLFSVNTSTSSLFSLHTSTISQEPLCCSIERNRQTMTLHNPPLPVVLDLVTICKDDIIAVSNGVESIISDYLPHNIPVINANGLLIKFKRNQKNKMVDDSIFNQKIIACLSTAGYKLSTVIHLKARRAVYFFILDRKHSKVVRQLTKETAGLGMKDSLTSYQTIVNRRKSSFFGSFNRKASLKRRVRQSLHQKFERRLPKCVQKRPEWEQQTTTDSGTDSEYESSSGNPVGFSPTLSGMLNGAGYPGAGVDSAP